MEREGGGSGFGSSLVRLERVVGVFLEGLLTIHSYILLVKYSQKLRKKKGGEKERIFQAPYPKQMILMIFIVTCEDFIVRNDYIEWVLRYCGIMFQ